MVDEHGKPSFDRVAHEYDETRLEYPVELLVNGIKKTLTDHSHGDLSEMQVLDAGVGTGQVARAMLEIGATVTGVDISPNMLEKAKERCAAYSNFTAIEGSLCDLEFPDNSFDIITSRWVLRFIPCWKEAVQELRRVLKPGGRLVLIYSNNMFNSRARTMFETVARKRGLFIGVPGPSDNTLTRYVKSQGATLRSITPEESKWSRDFPVEQMLAMLHARSLSHLNEIPDSDYFEVLEEVERELAKVDPSSLIDKSAVTTRFDTFEFTGNPTAWSNLRFSAVETAASAKRWWSNRVRSKL